MLLNQVEAFVEVARAGSFSRAAERLGVTQPALTGRIQGLEASLGARLFVRGRTGARLTEAGRTLLPYADRALIALQRGADLVRQVNGGEAGRLAIGAAPAVSTYVLPAVLRQFQAVHPHVQLSVRSGHSEEILEMVLREEVEVGLMRPIRHPDVESTPLYEDELVLVVPAAHRFAAGSVGSAGSPRRGAVRGIAMADMATEHLILFDRTSSYHELTSSILREAGIRPAGLIEVDNIDAAKRMVEEGLGVALLPRTAVAPELADGRLRHVPVSDMAPVGRRIVVVRRRDAGQPSTVVAAFLSTLQELRP
ncbi:MAG TPA: LysR family transcriptional regulator [Candidatus Limnocylindria bacterium]|nr:LysR family transcriptional regulator [Candidatus Limnocylindria bacterium]